MIRSINIGKTDQLVWIMIKQALTQIQDRFPVSSNAIGHEHHDYDGESGLLTDGITWMSPDQIDLLSDEEKKIIVAKMITTITAHFDAGSNKHRIEVKFSELIARLLAVPTGDQHHSSDVRDPSDDNAACISTANEDVSGEGAVKKSEGSGVDSAADHAYPVTVE